jgi:hypothetical protein
VVQGVVVPELLPPEPLPLEPLPLELLPVPDDELLPAPDEELLPAPDDDPLAPEPLPLDAPELDDPFDPPELLDPEPLDPEEPLEPCDPLELDCPVSVGPEVPHCRVRTETDARQPITPKTECFLIVASPTVEKTASLEHGTLGGPTKKCRERTAISSRSRTPFHCPM